MAIAKIITLVQKEDEIKLVDLEMSCLAIFGVYGASKTHEVRRV